MTIREAITYLNPKLEIRELVQMVGDLEQADIAMEEAYARVCRELDNLETERKTLWRKVDELEKGNPSSVAAAPRHLPQGEGQEVFLMEKRQNGTYWMRYEGPEDGLEKGVWKAIRRDLDTGEKQGKLTVIRGKMYDLEIGARVSMVEAKV